ncbi:hypothetical protein [Ramlibacter sp.]|uniref:hypothetical protein n=1 Tax=Ramlibacter sp. TaxID=1917967 RepID=UPI003D0E3CDD
MPRPLRARRERGNESSLDNALSAAAEFGLSRDAGARIVTEVAEGIAGWKDAFRACGVEAKDIDYVARFVDRDALRAQRDAHAAPKPRRAKSRPAP